MKQSLRWKYDAIQKSIHFQLYKEEFNLQNNRKEENVSLYLHKDITPVAQILRQFVWFRFFW